MPEKSVGGSGFEYYLQGMTRDRSAASTKAPLKLLHLLKNADGDMPILDLAAKGAMEIMLFMEAIRKMKNAGLIALEGSEDNPDNIRIKMTPVGENMASLMTSGTP